MPGGTPKRGPGRPPKGSGKANGSSKVVKLHAPTRRSARGTPASRSLEVVEVQATQDEADNLPTPATDAPSDNDGAWEIERQIILDRNQELSNKCAELEATLAQTLEESATQVQNAADVIKDNESHIAELQESLNVSEDRIDELRVDKMAFFRRAKQAEEREVQLRERIEILQCGQPGPSTGPSTGPSNGALAGASSSRPRPVLNQASSPGEDGAVAPGPSQPALGTTAAAQERAERYGRTPWSHEDEELFIRLIAQIGPPGKRPQWSKLARIWNTNFPDRPPRDQGQLKDKAWTIKAYVLLNGLPLPPKFDHVGIKAKVRAELIAAGLNPDRKERDVDQNFKPTNVRLT